MAQGLRDGGHEIRLDYLELTVDETGVAALRRGEDITHNSGISARLFGRTVELGRSRYVLREYGVAATRQVDGEYQVRVEPVDQQAGRLFQTIERR